ncbi:NADH:flavin oxidoreductase/NADH oxidase [Calothrix parasitica NIES-267]|uniref:NADH:flavin oxidoreductase/NADH oxidase n=1 Tax=Calothrix parasitica NIES-267 TaxID=1973488 RepID=A0A1Z4LHP6_9CYAN|nr:NADH:flavin oxidoreductase/NADH oxidase [Calothrix parasitica NIES-267]
MNLFSPIQLGSLNLPNRIVMAPMTRLRAVGSIPTTLMATYYTQRVSAGLIVTECTMISPLSNGYMNCPGIYSTEQIAGWEQVTKSVHDKGGRIFLQIWHCGRVAHPSLLNGEIPVAPSAIPGVGTLHTPTGKVNLETPRALDIDEIPQIVEQFRQAAENAKKAGFDGIELHGAFGYLIDQFIQDGSNQRTDKYGGSIENRARFLLEIVEAVSSVWDNGNIGIKLSPSNTFYGMEDSNPQATFSYIFKVLNQYKLAYIHLMEPNEIDLKNRDVINPALPVFRPLYQGKIITNGGYDKEKGNDAIKNAGADLVSFGKPYIANPDLPERFAADAELNTPDVKTFYGRGDENLEQGYTDYPVLVST